MINGKFYSGLPSEMMARSRTVNRQETHFFWPDETDAESVTSRSKRTVSKPVPVTTNNNNTEYTTQSDIKRKELVRKQLSSGIEFYDNVNAKTPEARRRRFKKIDNINLNNNDIDFHPVKKKLESFSSKIEFYDFEHEKNANNGKPIKTINVDEIKPKNESLQEMNKKRISFRTEDETAEKTKSILKNSEERSPVEKVLVKPLPKRGLLPKNLSKSVENISKLVKNVDQTDVNEKPEKLSTIIREVKSMNLSHERNSRKVDDYDRDERDSYQRGSNRIDPRRTNNNDDRDKGHRYTDRYENRGYQDDEYTYRNEERIRSEPYEYNDRYNDYEKRGDRGYVERHPNHERSQRVSYSQPQDNYGYKQQSHRFEESPIRRGRRSPNYDLHDGRYDREYDDEPKRTPIRDTKLTSRKSDPYYDDTPIRTIRHEEDEYSSTCNNRRAKQIPQHLQTNISFNGKVQPQAQRPMSVRNSAVTRVGVGLPDIE